MSAVLSIEPVNDSVMVVVCDPETGEYQYIQPAAFGSLGEGGTRVLRHHSEADGDRKREAREAILGRLDAAGGLLHIARGKPGAPVTGPDDIASRTSFTLDANKVNAFMLVASEVSRNSQIVKSTVRKPKTTGTAAAVEI